MVQTRPGASTGREVRATSMCPALRSGLPPRLLLLPAPRPAAPGLLDAEVELLDVFLLEEPGAGVFHHDAANFQDVAVVGDVKRHVGVLLHQEHGHAALAVDPNDDAQD